MKHRAGRQTHVILCGVEEVGVNVISLEAPSQKMEEAVVDAAANAGGNRGVRSETVRVDVCEPDKGFRKGTDLADGNPQSRSDQEIIQMGIDADWRADDADGAETGRAGKLKIAVVRAEVRKDTEERNGEKLAFDGAFPSVQTLASRAQISVVVGIAGVEIAGSGDLGRCRGGEGEQDESKDYKLAHKCDLPLRHFEHEIERKVLGCEGKRGGWHGIEPINAGHQPQMTQRYTETIFVYCPGSESPDDAGGGAIIVLGSA